MKGRNLVKLGFWLVVSLITYGYGFNEYFNGHVVQWYYYQAKVDGYAINANSFPRAAEERREALAIVRSQKIDGHTAVPVRKGDRLPEGANGVVPGEDVADGKRVALEGEKLVITIATEVKEQNGIRYIDSYWHKNVESNIWSGVWNIAMVMSLGFALGMLAQSFTDCIGITFSRVEHYQRPGDAGH